MAAPIKLVPQLPRNENVEPPQIPHSNLPATMPLPMDQVDGLQSVNSDSEDKGRVREALEKRCCEIGNKIGRESGLSKIDEPTLKSLDARGQAMALAMHRPVSDAQEQRRIARLQQLDLDYTARTEERDHAAQECRKHQLASADLGQRRPCPSISSTFRWAAAVALTISIAPTFHDLLTGLDPFFKWPVGCVCAWGVALLFVHGILQPPQHK